MKNPRTVLVIIAAVVLAIGTYIAFDKYSRRSDVARLVEDASTRLREALEAQASGRDDFDIDAHLAVVQANADKVRVMKDKGSLAPLGDAADDYLVTAREILRRHADIKRARTRLAVSFDTLSQHIKTDRGAREWTQQAVKLKETADKDLRDYRIAAESYATLTSSLAASQAKIAAHVEPRYLIDEKPIAEARARALDAYAKADQNMKAVAGMGTYRSR